MGLLRWLRVALRYGPRAGSAKRWATVCLVALATPAAAEMRIVALGDSLVHGYGLPPAEGFVPQLEDWLDGEGVDATVVNAGVSGDTTAGGLARFDWALGSEGADALIVVLGGNDLLRGIDPETSRANLDALLEKADARDLPVLLAGMQAPGNYGPAFKEAFDSMYPELAEAHGAILYPYFLAGVVEDRSLWQPDAIHPNADGVAEIVRRIGPSVLELVDRAEGS